MGCKMKVRRFLYAVTAAAVIVCVFCAGARANDYFVSPSGDDSAAGSAKAPFKTITHAFEALGPGDTLKIAPGVYRESPTLTVKGTREAPVTIVGVDAPFIAPTGRDGILVWQSSFVTIEGIVIKNYARFGPDGKPLFAK